MLQGGVDLSHVLWREYDGIGRESRNGVYFLERGFGVRGGMGNDGSGADGDLADGFRARWTGMGYLGARESAGFTRAGLCAR